MKIFLQTDQITSYNCKCNLLQINENRRLRVNLNVIIVALSKEIICFYGNRQNKNREKHFKSYTTIISPLFRCNM